MTCCPLERAPAGDFADYNWFAERGVVLEIAERIDEAVAAQGFDARESARECAA